MKRNFFYNSSIALVIAGAILCCSFTSSNNDESIEMKPCSHTVEKAAPGKDSIQIKRTILDFLQWYKKNIQKANSFKMLGQDAKGYSIVNKKACADYLSFIKGSGFVSGKFIGYWQKYFDDKAIQMKEEKLSKDDVPEGFDFDLILITQEPELVLDNIGKLHFKMTSIHKNNAVVSVSLPSDDRVLYDIELQKINHGWLIDFIGTANYD